MDGLYSTLEEYALAHIWHFSSLVGIEVNHVALSEIGQKVVALFRYIERYGVVAAESTAASLLLDGQPRVDVSRLHLL